MEYQQSSTARRGLGKHQLFNIILLAICLAIAGLYLWKASQTTEPTVTNATPHSTNTTSESEPSRTDKPAPIAITEEEKSLLAEKQHLTELAEKGDKYLQDFNEAEKQVYIKGLEAEKAIATLKAKAEAKNTKE